jgi:poly-gamma-glutamate capsule biosynthesis protein CapA/YwtB (metallophosphatase superfamily)
MSSVAKGDLTIMAVGDVHVDRADPPSVFEHVAPLLRQGDIVVGNLEGLNCDRGAPIIGKIEVGSRHLRSSPDNLRALESAGFNAMILANNHNMDYGPEGLLQTIALLDEKKIAHSGAGRNLEDAHRPAIVERNGTRVALLSYTSVFPPAGYAADENTPGVATIKVGTSYQAPENVQYQPGFPPLVTTTPDPVQQDRMVSDVRQARQLADIVLVAFHWGVSYGHGKVVGYQKELGRAAIDAGADLIMGAHPHALMAMEMYKGKLICYSMGNFVMDGFTSSHFGSDTMILKCHVRNKQIVKCSIVPARISAQWQPTLLTHEQSVEVMKKLDSMSADFGTMYSMDGDEIVVGGPRPGTPPAQRGLSIEPHRGLPVLVDALLPLPYITKKLRGIYGKESDA